MDADPIFAGLCYNQLNNNLTSQAATMTTHGIPNDVLSNLDPIALIIFIPISEMFVSRILLNKILALILVYYSDLSRSQARWNQF